PSTSALLLLIIMTPPPPLSTLFPYTTLFRSLSRRAGEGADAGRVVDRQRRVRHRGLRGHDPEGLGEPAGREGRPAGQVRFPSRVDRKSTRLNSSHVSISYAVFCLKKKKKKKN